MRKLSKWVLVSAAVLAVIACQRERTFTEESSKGIKEVETEFILSVATNAPQTKMASNIVQQTGSFRGIENAKLITYNMQMPAQTDTPFVYKTSAPAADTYKIFELGSLYSQGQVDLDKNEEAAASYKLAADNKDFVMRAHAAFNYGRLLETMEKYAEAAEAYQKLNDELPDDTFAKLAKTRLLQLKLDGKVE